MPPFSDHLCDRQCIQNPAESESDLRKVQVVDHQSVLVSLARGSVECCDHETGVWRVVTTLHSPDGQVIPGLSAGHTYSFRVDGGHPLPSVTIPHESRWQQEQFERRYHQFHIIGDYLHSKLLKSICFKLTKHIYITHSGELRTSLFLLILKP